MEPPMNADNLIPFFSCPRSFAVPLSCIFLALLASLAVNSLNLALHLHRFFVAYPASRRADTMELAD